MNLYSVPSGHRELSVTFFTPGYWDNSGAWVREYRWYTGTGSSEEVEHRG